MPFIVPFPRVLLPSPLPVPLLLGPFAKFSESNRGRNGAHCSPWWTNTQLPTHTGLTPLPTRYPPGQTLNTSSSQSPHVDSSLPPGAPESVLTHTPGYTHRDRAKLCLFSEASQTGWSFRNPSSPFSNSSSYWPPGATPTSSTPPE